MCVCVDLHVVDVEILLDDGGGFLVQLLLRQGRLGGGLGRRRRGSCLPLHCSNTHARKGQRLSFPNIDHNNYTTALIKKVKQKTCKKKLICD